MKNVILIIGVLCLSALSVCSAQTRQVPPGGSGTVNTNLFPPSNTDLTTETLNLYYSLQRMARKGVMFGHEDDLTTGVGWKYEDGRSDTKELTGAYPVVVGAEIGNIELGLSYSADGTSFEKMKANIRKVYAQGGIVTLLWSLNNPVDTTQNRKSTLDSTIHKLFESPVAITRYQRWLDKLSVFLKELKGPGGEQIPVILRTLHEHTGNWFWWGRSHCTPEEYVKMWRYTVDYLRHIAGVRNVLYAYCPDKFASSEEYLERYPGDDYVDILGFDMYDKPAYHTGTENQFVIKAKTMIATLRELAGQKHKVYAMNETGLTLVPLADWWTKSLLPAIKNSGLAYVLAWRNVRPDAFWSAYPGQVSAADFVRFYHDSSLIFQDQIAPAELYRSH